MYTFYLLGSASSLRLRGKYWELSEDEERVFWMIHEFGRYFAYLEDQREFMDPNSVQTLDLIIEFFNIRYPDIHPPVVTPGK